ncbi:MAG TPA: helix-turn-helix transcriptional regulator [Blastocatellia bacterium]|nr:helix-turn-helix transcriptional regulator [Blastocatellia bacterium]
MDEKELSLRDVAERSGGLISHSAVADLRNANTAGIRLDTLEGLLKGLRVSEADLILAIAGPAQESDSAYIESRFQGLYRKYSSLPAADQAELQIVLEMLDREIDFRFAHPTRRKAAPVPVPKNGKGPVQDISTNQGHLFSEGAYQAQPGGRRTSKRARDLKEDLEDIRRDARGRKSGKKKPPANGEGERQN